MVAHETNDDYVLNQQHLIPEWLSQLGFVSQVRNAIDQVMILDVFY